MISVSFGIAFRQLVLGNHFGIGFPNIREAMQRFSDLLESVQQGSLQYSSYSILRSGQGNNTATDKSNHATGWSRSLPNSLLGFSIKVPYANADGCEVNAASARALGRDLAAALNAFLRENLDHPLKRL